MRPSRALRLLWLATLAGGIAAAPASAQVPVEPAAVVRSFPHNPQAYTEGLFFLDGVLFESTGQVGRSSVRKVDLATGRVLNSAPVPPPLFGEGIAPWRDQIVSLTWKDGVGLRWSRDGFRRLGTFRYPGEGWALTSDGRQFIQSDGTPVLRFVDPETFRVRRTLTVTADGQPVANLNELEYVNGEILANVWLTDRIARIDPRSGRVRGWIDVSALHAKAGTTGVDDVANGIAWDPARKRLFVTGKNWPLLFEIAPPRR